MQIPEQQVQDIEWSRQAERPELYINMQQLLSNKL